MGKSKWPNPDHQLDVTLLAVKTVDGDLQALTKEERNRGGEALDRRNLPPGGAGGRAVIDWKPLNEVDVNWASPDLDLIVRLRIDAVRRGFNDSDVEVGYVFGKLLFAVQTFSHFQSRVLGVPEGFSLLRGDRILGGDRKRVWFLCKRNRGREECKKAALEWVPGILKLAAVGGEG